MFVHLVPPDSNDTGLPFIGPVTNPAKIALVNPAAAGNGLAYYIMAFQKLNALSPAAPVRFHTRHAEQLALIFAGFH